MLPRRSFLLMLDVLSRYPLDVETSGGSKGAQA